MVKGDSRTSFPESLLNHVLCGKKSLLKSPTRGVTRTVLIRSRGNRALLLVSKNGAFPDTRPPPEVKGALSGVEAAGWTVKILLYS